MKIKSVDGLRGIAAFNVVISHFLAAYLPAVLHKNYPQEYPENTNPTVIFEILTSPIFSIFYNGHFAVLVFFVISGYILTLPYFSNPSQSELILKRRLCGRYLRLNIPIAVSIMLSYCVYSLGLYYNFQAANISGVKNFFYDFYPQGLLLGDAIAEAAYRNIIYGQYIFLPPLWTMKIEFWGSILLFWFYIRKPRDITFIPILIVLPFIYASQGADSIYYYTILAGSLLNYIKHPIKYKFFFFCLGVYFGGFQYKSFMYDFLPELGTDEFILWDKKNFYNAIGAFFITMTVIQGFGSRIFESRFAKFLGKVSFSLYLTHFIVLCSLSSFLYINIPQSSYSLAFIFFAYVFVSFIVSMIFERVIDRKSIAISHIVSSLIFPGKSDDDIKLR